MTKTERSKKDHRKPLLGAGVRIPVAFGHQLQNADPDLCLGGDPVLDGVGLELGWTFV